jgi:hypothetical protein
MREVEVNVATVVASSRVTELNARYGSRAAADHSRRVSRFADGRASGTAFDAPDAHGCNARLKQRIHLTQVYAGGKRARADNESNLATHHPRLQRDAICWPVDAQTSDRDIRSNSIRRRRLFCACRRFVN